MVVTVISTFLPRSAATGVYVNANVKAADVSGVTDPAPSFVIVTRVALLNVFPLIVTGAVPQVLPFVLLNVRVGGFRHPQDTIKLVPVVVHKSAFRTVIE